ncbi:hypothetical protein CBOM_02953 [Ceraceosorus bombacis]|uniref:Uncharacterized protein n=1 Tax=Ceraceosorus bombacis TaxID=401625 RepID=A0A0P1BGM6_9BASI|nr:hypothetical protein CBOM_02953 [Ceraceosorus bombacis]
MAEASTRRLALIEAFARQQVPVAVHTSSEEQKVAQAKKEAQKMYDMIMQTFPDPPYPSSNPTTSTFVESE